MIALNEGKTYPRSRWEGAFSFLPQRCDSFDWHYLLTLFLLFSQLEADETFFAAEAIISCAALRHLPFLPDF